MGLIGRGRERGLRGLSIDQNSGLTYCASHDRILCLDERFAIQDYFSNRFLGGLHEIHCHEDMLYITSTKFDAIVQWDIKSHKFVRGIQFKFTENKEQLQALQFDPEKKRCALKSGSRLHLNNVFVDDRGIFTHGTKINKLMYCDWDLSISEVMHLQCLAHNVVPFKQGVLFNNTDYNHATYKELDSGKEKVYHNAKINKRKVKNIELPDSIARVGFARGLCWNDEFLCSGSSPANVSLFDIKTGLLLRNVIIDYDKRFAIHGLEMLPDKIFRE